MTLTPEWRRRIERWRKVLRELWFRPLGEVALEGFTTFDYLTAEAAGAGPFRPMPSGTPSNYQQGAELSPANLDLEMAFGGSIEDQFRAGLGPGHRDGRRDADRDRDIDGGPDGNRGRQRGALRQRHGRSDPDRQARPN